MNCSPVPIAISFARLMVARARMLYWNSPSMFVAMVSAVCVSRDASCEYVNTSRGSSDEGRYFYARGLSADNDATPIVCSGDLWTEHTPAQWTCGVFMASTGHWRIIAAVPSETHAFGVFDVLKWNDGDIVRIQGGTECTSYVWNHGEWCWTDDTEVRAFLDNGDAASMLRASLTSGRQTLQAAIAAFGVTIDNGGPHALCLVAYHALRYHCFNDNVEGTLRALRDDICRAKGARTNICGDVQTLTATETLVSAALECGSRFNVALLCSRAVSMLSELYPEDKHEMRKRISFVLPAVNQCLLSAGFLPTER